MNSRKVSSSRMGTMLNLAMLAGLLSVSSGLAAASTLESFETCQSEAEVAYGSVDQRAEVRLDGVRKSGKQLRLKVFTPEGEKLTVLCNVDRRSGEVVSMDPPARDSESASLPSSD